MGTSVAFRVDEAVWIRVRGRIQYYGCDVVFAIPLDTRCLSALPAVVAGRVGMAIAGTGCDDLCE